MGWTGRVSRASDAFGSQVRATARRVLFASIVLIGLVRWWTGAWWWWLAFAPLLVGLWWLWRVFVDGVRHVRGSDLMPPPFSRW